jgi:hypothetical protein
MAKKAETKVEESVYTSDNLRERLSISIQQAERTVFALSSGDVLLSLLEKVSTKIAASEQILATSQNPEVLLDVCEQLDNATAIMVKAENLLYTLFSKE